MPAYPLRSIRNSWVILDFKFKIDIFSKMLKILEESVPKEWPHEGKIKFEGVSLRYDPSRDPVVSKLDLEIPAGQKVRL